MLTNECRSGNQKLCRYGTFSSTRHKYRSTLAGANTDFITCALGRKTVDRTHLWRAATPQLFPYHLLLQALSSALEEGVDITDEASAMQRAGYTPELVECSADNIKVTSATDIALAEHYLAVQKAEKTHAH